VLGRNVSLPRQALANAQESFITSLWETQPYLRGFDRPFRMNG
jgi:hypothetical protein